MVFTGRESNSPFGNFSSIPILSLFRELDWVKCDFESTILVKNTASLLYAFQLKSGADVFLCTTVSHKISTRKLRTASFLKPTCSTPKT